MPHVVHIHINEKEWAILQARSVLECRKVAQIVKSAALFYAKYGASKLSTAQIDKNNTIPNLAMKLMENPDARI